VQKNALGMIQGLARNATVQLKMAQEAAFSDWVANDPERRARYGEVLGKLKALDQKATATTLEDLMFETMMSSRTGPFFRTLIDMVRGASRQQEEAPRYHPQLMRDDLLNLQAPILAYLIDEARALPKEQVLRGVLEFPSGEHGTLAALRQALNDSKLTTVKGREELLDGGRQAVEASTDPLVKLAKGIADEWGLYARRRTIDSGERMVLGPLWIDAQQQWRGKSFYPDANSTLRVAIANVKGYSPRDGVWYPPHTTVAGILEKDTGKAPFDVPEALKRAAGKRKISEFFDQKIGDVPVCFLADGDTTGGNSGSPVINGSGELVGLNFDRAFESVSGDYAWSPARSRNISVDVRYIQWFMEQVVPAPHLLDEMHAATAKLAR
jgi:hypothetical protein